MKQMFFFVPAILWEHLAPKVICKQLEVSLGMPNKVPARVWVLEKGRNTSNKQAVIYLFITCSVARRIASLPVMFLKYLVIQNLFRKLALFCC